MDIKRIKQVIQYGWMHAGQIAEKESKGIFYRLKIFSDIVYCYNAYRMWSNQYLKEKFHKKDADERKQIGCRYLEAGIKRDAWQNDFRENKKFLLKYSQLKYELSGKREARNEAYAKRYNAGKGLFVEHGVELSRQHYLPGTIKIGNNVLLAKNVFIDYSGFVDIRNGVKLTNGVIIESHHRDIDAYNEGRDVNVPTNLVIMDNAYIGSRAIILDSCNYIGKNARIGAGAVVTKDVPDNAVVGGVPAKVIRFLNADKQETKG